MAAYMTASEAARQLRKSQKTIRRWCNLREAGPFPGARKWPNDAAQQSHWHIPEDEVQALMTRRAVAGPSSDELDRLMTAALQRAA